MMYAQRSQQKARFTLLDSDTDNVPTEVARRVYECVLHRATPPALTETRINFFDRN
jgi:hypothetical protein